MSNFWREIQNGLSDCKYWGISEKILRKEYFSIQQVFGKHLASIWQVFGKHLASIWQVFGKYLASIWQEFVCLQLSKAAVPSVSDRL